MDPQFIAYHRVCLGLEEREYSIVCVSHSLAARPNGLDQLLKNSSRLMLSFGKI